MSIRSVEFDRFALEIWNQSEIEHTPEDDGVCLVIRTDDQLSHIPIDQNILESDKFAPIEERDQRTTRCYVCGDSGGDMERYQYTGFTLHQRCRSEFKEYVRNFLDTSNGDIVLETI